MRRTVFRNTSYLTKKTGKQSKAQPIQRRYRSIDINLCKHPRLLLRKHGAPFFSMHKRYYPFVSLFMSLNAH